MKDIARRFPENPILIPADIKPSNEGLNVVCLLNPGVFLFEGKTWLLIRVAENVLPKADMISLPVLSEEGIINVVDVDEDDINLDKSDPRVMHYKGQDYLTTLSHLRLVCSNNGINFYEPEGIQTKISGTGAAESFGIEDCRVSKIENTYYLTYTAVSATGVGVGLRTTKDWSEFKKSGMILPPHNKDCAIFEEKINGKFYALHRPSSVQLGGNYIWIAESPDGIHWGNHQCIVKTRKNHWDSARVGAGAAPIKTNKGWLEIYHGADENHKYCLGAFLMDLKNPYKVISRTTIPIMVPTEEYELNGFFGKVVFTNGHVVTGDELTIYYGAADEFVCGAKFSIQEIINLLQ